MATRTRSADLARHQWQRLMFELGDEFRTARHIMGLTLRQVGEAIGVSQSEVSRRELGKSPWMTFEEAAIHAAAVGLRLSAKLWPVGGGVRDAAQARYIAAFIARIGRSWKVTLEAAIDRPGDLRAVDILLVNGPHRIAVEVITRLADLQAQIRAAEQKARDIGATRLIIVVAATHANRRALVELRGTIVGAFDLDSRAVVASLASGRDPGRDALILFDAGRPPAATGLAATH